MKRFRQTVVTAAFFIVACLAGRAWATPADWQEKWAPAKEAAQKLGRPLIVIFAQAHCPECQKMDRFLDSRTAQGALRNAVKVRLEFTDYAQLAQHFSITVTPTLLLLTPETKYQDYVYRQEGALNLAQIVSLGKSVDALAAAPPPAESVKPAATPSPSPQAKPSQPQTKLSKRAKTAVRKASERSCRQSEEYGYYEYCTPICRTPKTYIQGQEETPAPAPTPEQQGTNG